MTEIDFNAISKAVEEGYIKVERHPSTDLRIYNYTVKAQFGWYWPEEVQICRGLIVNDDHQIVARPFRKFFSYEQLNGIVPDEPFEVYEKLDGSLGVLYFAHGIPMIATRGSFVSYQAQWATKWLHGNYKHVKFNPELTYLFEIIYPDNRIVVDYGDTRDLFLLAIIHTATGEELPLGEIGMPVVKRYDGIRDFDTLKGLQEANKEGFVIRFKSGYRVKMKFEEYKRLHKLLTGVSPKLIWETLRDGKELAEILERVPDEYYNWVRKIEWDLNAAFATIVTEARAEFKVLEDRKQTALYFQTCKHPAVMFAMLDKKDYGPIIWKQLKPKGEAPFKCVSEDFS